MVQTLYQEILPHLKTLPLMKLLPASSSTSFEIRGKVDAAGLQEERIQAVGVHSLNDISFIITLNDIQQKYSNDNIYDKLITTIRNGFPTNKSAIDPQLREYWEVRRRLSCLDGVALMDKYIIIPQSLRWQVLKHLHAARELRV